MDWLDKELAFITWLYKYKAFLGTLKRKEFKYFPTKEEALKQFELGNKPTGLVITNQGNLIKNKTDARIICLWNRGNHSLASIARHIGRPGELQLIKDTLIRKGLIK